VVVICTPNKVTFLRVMVGFAAVALFGHSWWGNLLAVALTLAAIALDALDGPLARRRKMSTPVGAQLDFLGDRITENLYFTYFAVVGMVSLWLPVLFFARGAATDFLRGLAFQAGYSGWGAQAMSQQWWTRCLVASRWSRGAYATLKGVCFCSLGLELALTQGPVGLLEPLSVESQAALHRGAQTLAWFTGAVCVLRGLPVFLEGWKFLTGALAGQASRKTSGGGAAGCEKT
jgi:phosphatidylglycerophosphate synthase